MKQCKPEGDEGPRDSGGYIKPGVVAVAGLFRHPTTLTMNKTVIQYRNKTISHYHDHAHDHVHLHGPGDWASLLIAVIVMVGVLIAVIAVACLVSNKKTTIRGAEKYGGLKSVINTICQARTSWFFILGVGVAAPQPATNCWGRIPEQFP